MNELENFLIRNDLEILKAESTYVAEGKEVVTIALRSRGHCAVFTRQVNNLYNIGETVTLHHTRRDKVLYMHIEEQLKTEIANWLYYVNLINKKIS